MSWDTAVYGLTLTLSGSNIYGLHLQGEAARLAVQTLKVNAKLTDFGRQKREAVVIKKFHTILGRFQAQPGSRHLSGVGQGQP